MEDELNLSWTVEPKRKHALEGHMQCIVSEPRRRAGEKPLHSHHLMRQLELRPIVAGGHLSDSRIAISEQIRVSEKDFRNCGDDLTLLKSCALPPVGFLSREQNANMPHSGSPAFVRPRRRGLTSSTLGNLATSYDVRKSAARGGSRACSRGGSLTPAQPSRREAEMALGLEAGSQYLRPLSGDSSQSSGTSSTSASSTSSRCNGGMRGVALVRQSRMTASTPALLKLS